MVDIDIRQALTFDDVLLEPARSTLLPAEADTRTSLTGKRIALPADVVISTSSFSVQMSTR